MMEGMLVRKVGNHVPACIASKRITPQYGLFHEEVWQHSVILNVSSSSVQPSNVSTNSLCPEQNNSVVVFIPQNEKCAPLCLKHHPAAKTENTIILLRRQKEFYLDCLKSK
jgi:hypothetical protein